MILDIALFEWDSRSTGPISQLYEEHASDPAFVDRLLALSATPEAEQGATWLLKHHLEHGEQFSLDQTVAWVSRFEHLTHWQSTLRALQTLQHLTIPPAAPARFASGVERFVRACLTHERTFIRAWAIGEFVELSRRQSELAPEAEALIEAAYSNEPASVKARIRQVLAAPRT